MVKDHFPTQYHIGATLYNISTISLSKAKKRWRLAYFSIHFSNSISKLSKKPVHYPITTEIVAAASSRDDDYSERLYDVDQTELVDLMKTKNLKMLIRKFHGVNGLALALETNLESGTKNGQDNARRKRVFGSNTCVKKRSKSFASFVVMACKDTTILILLACAALSLGFGFKQIGAKQGWYEGCSIVLAIFQIIIVSTFIEYCQERHFDDLSKINNNIKTEVIREGRSKKISILDVVVGDVVVLNVGDQIPADGLFINGQSLYVDESSMTGESDHIHIDAIKKPFLFSGSKVADGHARMLVIAVGVNTYWEKTMSSTRSGGSKEQTPMQSRLIRPTTIIAYIGLIVGFIEFAIMLIRYCTGYTRDKNGNWNYDGQCTDTNDILNSFTRAVMATAEGLPLAVTFTLARAVKRMMAHQVLVRKLSACDTIGAATILCTDKTGTLTTNQMKVTRFWLGNDLVEDDSYREVDEKILKLYREGAGLNTAGDVYKSIPNEYTGSPTEKAILSWGVTNLGIDMEKLKEDSTILHVETFNSEKRRSGVSVKRKEDNTIHVHWKGAAEVVLEMCSNYYQKDGLVKAINQQEKTQFKKIIQGMAASSLRCIAFAHKEIPADHGTTEKTLNREELTLLGIVGIKDPCRPGAKRAIDTFKSAGVQVKMITGDNIFTAKAIATECGILEAGEHVSKGEVIEGRKFRNYTNDKRMNKVDNIRVMARSSPSDKLLMVQCLKKKGHVVAVTGDGSNDAPALKEANVGLSMGIQGTVVAKESSDIVILDDDFASFFEALKWGRCAYINIQKFLQFQVPANFVALVINFVKAASAGGIPLTSVQLLWTNFIINILGALAFAFEKPTKELMQKPPVGQATPLITNVMLRNMSAQSLYQIVILLTFEFRGRSMFNVNEKVKNTIIFNTFVLCQVFNEFNSRKLEKRNIFKGLRKNRVFLGIIGVTIILQVLLMEFLQAFAGIKRLNGKEWGICIVFAALSWPMGVLVKLIPVPERPFLSFIQEWV
uniref:calcium-transporting ATPase 12, plasma membrane-type-like n=1 Tax=Erigeron canadensis TaxID=72917 RepID=UPI001CB905D0|nr:calcium-transporting ATPase 12, plasma membrane-type-like [Erigeron canadensis]